MGRSPLNLHISDDSRALLVRLAADDRRSMSAQVEWLLAEEIKRRQPELSDTTSWQESLMRRVRGG